MKNILKLILLIIFITLSCSAVYAQTACPTCKKVRVKYVGCENKPVVNQKVSFKMRFKGTGDAWVLIKSYVTDGNGIINVSHSFNLEQGDYLLSATGKTDQIFSQEIINNLVGNGIENVFKLQAQPFNEAVVNVAAGQLKWSEQLGEINRVNAEAMSVDALKADLKKSLTYYDSDYKTKLTDIINRSSKTELVSMHYRIKTEMQEVLRYYYGVEDSIFVADPFSKKYYMWCTAFARYVIRKAGGPDIGTFGASEAYNYFTNNNGKIVNGTNGEKYRVSQISMAETIAYWNKYKAINIKPGNIYLERVYNAAYTGHAAIIYSTENYAYPHYFTIDGNMSFFVTTNTKEIQPDKPDSVLQKSGVLTCVQ